VNALMMHGRNNGKKLMAVRIVKHAMDIVHLLSDQNPLQVIVDSIINRCAADQPVPRPRPQRRCQPPRYPAPMSHSRPARSCARI
jgi:ribosomal protein S7